MSNPVVCITGASRGIGAACAITFAQAGYDVVINYNSNEQAAHEVAQACASYGVKTLIFKANVSHMDAVEAMMSAVMDTFQRLDVMVNNAGIVKDNLVVRMSESDFDAVINVNLKGVFCCSKLAAKIMMKQRSGTIINVTSVIGLTGNSGQANYAAAKSGIIGFTKSLALELGSRGVSVNAIAPGFIETDLTDALDEPQRQAVLSRIPLKRLGKPQDIADGVLFLARASYMSAQTLVIDGGLTHG